MLARERYQILILVSVFLVGYFTWRMCYLETGGKFCWNCGQVENNTYFSVRIGDWMILDTPVSSSPAGRPYVMEEILDPDSTCKHEKIAVLSRVRVVRSVLIPGRGFHMHGHGYNPFVCFEPFLQKLESEPQFKQYILQERPDVVEKISVWFHTSPWDAEIQDYLPKEYEEWKNLQSQPKQETAE